MKAHSVVSVALLFSVGFFAAGARANEDKPERGKARTVTVLRSWDGVLPDAALRKHLPANGFVLDQETWSGLWRAWRRRENVPAVDFQQQMVLVFTASGPNRVGYDKLTLDEHGNLRINVMSTLIGGPGFGYLMLCIPREGVKSVNGTPLPGAEPPPRRPRRRRPQRPAGEPGAVPGSPGGSPPYPGPDVAEAEPGAITELDRVRPKRSVWKDSTWKRPFVLKSARQAAEFFDDDQLANLLRQVDFSKQFVLLFAWRGSGQDRLEVEVAESYPEQIRFLHKPGRTRDLVEHVRAYALRANVTWQVRESVTME